MDSKENYKYYFNLSQSEQNIADPDPAQSKF